MSFPTYLPVCPISLVILSIYIYAICMVTSDDVEPLLRNDVPVSPCNGLITTAKNSDNFRLFKLLDIQLNGKFGDIRSDIQNTISSDIEVKDSRGQLPGTTDVRTEFPLENYPNKNATNSMAKQLYEILSVSNEINHILLELRRQISTFIDGPMCSCCAANVIKYASVGVQYNKECIKSELKSSVPKKSLPKSCKEILENGNNITGIYEIQPRPSKNSIMVLCDMTTKGGGWTHIHKRYDGSQDFYLGWREYKFGFGNLEGEFWLGLENIYALTGMAVNELLVEIEDRDGVMAYAFYKAFSISPETDGYTLNVLRGYSGDAENSLEYHLGSKFTTKDFDQDVHSDNCAQKYSGAWWYKGCHNVNLNGKYINLQLPAKYEHQGMHWKGFRGLEYSHAKARMLVRST